ncbi:MAG: hypothetical protein EBX40_02850 [Gammaproteobacteria bacterium]|nr:hypothetical protein [Gammaproteobacteria bacterium]
MIYKFDNWDQYNKRAKEYKNPVWFSFQNDFATNKNFFGFTDQERLIFIYLLCEASQQNTQGEFSLEIDHFAYHTRQKEKDILSTLKKLEEKQILTARDRDGIVSGSYRDRDLAVTEQNNTEQYNTLYDSDESHREEFNLEQIYQEYPRRRGQANKGKGLEKLRKLIKSRADFELALAAVRGYRLHLISQQKINTEFVKMFSSFWDAQGDWKEWAAARPSDGAEITDKLIKQAKGEL